MRTLAYIFCSAIAIAGCDDKAKGDAKTAKSEAKGDAKGEAKTTKAAADAKADADAKAGADAKGDARPALNEGAAANAVEALRTISDEHRSLAAGRALSEIEGGRLPDPAIALLAALPDTPPEQRGLQIAKALEADLFADLDALCSGEAKTVMTAVAQAAPDAKSKLLYDGCKLSRVRLVEPEEAATAEPMPLALAHVLAWHLQQGGGMHEHETTLLRELTSH